MKNLIIVGSGDFGIEMYETVVEINASEPTWNVLGFLDDDKPVGTVIYDDVAVIGTVKDWEPQTGEWFGIGIANPAGKEKVATKLNSQGANFATIVSPRSFVSSTAHLGTGCFIFKNSNINHGTVLGDFVSVGCSMIGGNAHIGNYSTTTSFVNITSCKIGQRVFVGSHAVVLHGLKVGDDCFISAGSIVMGNVKPGRRMFGCPARPM